MPTKQSITPHLDPTDINAKLAAQLLGLTRTRLSQLCSEGIIRNNGKRGRYNLNNVARDYAAYLKKSRRGTAQERLIRQQERKLKLQNDKLESTLVDRDQVVELFQLCCSALRNVVNQIPKNVAARIAKTTNKKDIRDVLSDALEEAISQFTAPLEELTKGAGKR